MEIFGISLYALILIEIVAFIAATVKGSTGFGFGLLAFPLMVFILDAKLVIAIIVPIQIVIDLFILSKVWRYLDLKKAVPIILAGAAGIPIGNLIILTITSETLRIIVFSVVIVSSIIMITGYTVRISRERLAGSVTGITAGTLYASTAISGPPMILFMLNQRWNRETFMSTFSTASLCMETLTLVSFLVSGVITTESLGLDLLLLPAILASFYISSRLLTIIKPALFRTIAIYLVFLTGVVGLATHFIQ